MWIIYNGKLYASTDAGQKWKVILEGKLRRIFPDPANPQTFYATGSQGLLKTTDGQSFTEVSGSPKPLENLAIDAQNPSVLYATRAYNEESGVWKYDGQAWSKILDQPLISDVAIDPTDGRRLAVSTNRDPFKDVCESTGVWISEDGGGTWSNQRTGLTCLRGWSVAFNPHQPEKLYFASQGAGFFVTSWPKSGSPQP